jgi:hypothetical protein
MAQGDILQQARSACWMKLEDDRRAPRDLEKRAQIVQSCVDNAMKGQAQ